MSLESVGQLVAQHTSTPVQKQSKTDLEKQLVRSMFTWMGWGLLILGIGVVMAVTDKTFVIGSLFKFISILLILVGVGVTTAGVFRGIIEGTRLPDKKSADPISDTVDTKSLPARDMPASLPSVTERTTQLLPIDDAPARERSTNKVIDSNGRE